MSLGWQCANYDSWSAPCLVSSSRPFYFRAGRDMTGVEAMALQGWEISDVIQNSDYGRFPDPMLLSLAGNAMNWFVLSYVLLGAVAYLNWDLAEAARSAHLKVGATIASFEGQGEGAE
eukprot:7439715-Pyramimonas_sp.AAC.1